MDKSHDALPCLATIFSEAIEMLGESNKPLCDADPVILDSVSQWMKTVQFLCNLGRILFNNTSVDCFQGTTYRTVLANIVTEAKSIPGATVVREETVKADLERYGLYCCVFVLIAPG